ncbi:MAG: hypothetical protein ACT4O0_08105 [Pseudonocardia sp.]
MAEAALDGWVERLDEIAVATADATLRENGFVQPPTVHLLSAELDPPYVGYLTCRPFYRGTDAATAIARLGVLPSALGASRLVLTWENADLCTALELPGADGFPPGVVVVDAGRDGHVVRWHPMRLHVGRPGPDRFAPVSPEWGRVQRLPEAALPEPIAELLAVWRTAREWPDVEIVHVCASLEGAGYQMRWITRQPAAAAPTWARLLAPLMQ